jgi:phosphonate degradation associated HDIG domain protein
VSGPEFLDRLSELFARRGAELYGGEAVSQLAHALQAATEAEAAGAGPALIAAALLHDVGHLIPGDDFADDPRHEIGGAAFLGGHFGPEVTGPISLHVPAKRYLCATDPAYAAGLSPASVASLRAQGGPMSADEVVAFRSHPHFESAVALRRWDDAAKVPGLSTPSFGHFRPYLEASVLPETSR